MTGWTVATGFLLAGVLHVCVNALRHHDRATPVAMRALRAIGGAGLVSLAVLAARAGVWPAALLAAVAGLPLLAGLLPAAVWSRALAARPPASLARAGSRRLGPTP